ncbi:MAG TPA: LysR family transcriptional regulator [Dyella sp.]|uniref:LysR family transcriptional regulator n=1 Tax=Dyella sp. TaxID=1869338 RepID=UPI002F95C92D
MLSAPVLAWLRCFHVAARQRSFTRAAGELHITQGAVSQQVKQLERWLGWPLFLRTPRGLVLTPEGTRLAVAACQAFETLGDVVAQLRQPVHRRALVLSCAPSFAMTWLTPRLGGFFRAHKDIDLHIQGDLGVLDVPRMHRARIDVAIRFDTGYAGSLHSCEFLQEWLLPVASPEYLAAHPRLRSIEGLRADMLLHDSVPWDGAGEYDEWHDWLRHAGVSLPDVSPGQRFNLSQLAVNAALAGQGVALGRTALVLEDVLAGRLVDLFGMPVRSSAGYRFVYLPGQPEAKALESWLVDEGRIFADRRCRALGIVTA